MIGSNSEMLKNTNRKKPKTKRGKPQTIPDPSLQSKETFTTLVINMMEKGASVCNLARDFENSDPFYSVLKTLRLPLLSYPDIACQMLPLNRSTRTTCFKQHRKLHAWLMSMSVSENRGYLDNLASWMGKWWTSQFRDFPTFHGFPLNFEVQTWRSIWNTVHWKA